MSKKDKAPGVRERAWKSLATALLVIGALVTAYLVYRAFAHVS